MSEQVKYNFGVKALIFYNRTTFKPVGIFRVISNVEFAREIEKLPLTGGHHNGPWAVEAGEPTNTLTATLMEFPDFAFTELDNATRTVTSSEDTTGYIGTIINKEGTSVFNATTGVATATLISGSGALLPFGKVVLVATAAKVVDIYLLGDVASGPIPVTDELTKIASSVSIADSGATIDVAAYGIRLTSGSGTIAMTTGDTAVFDTRPANSKTTEIVMPDSSDIKTLGCILVYPKNSSKQQKIIDFPKVAVAGTPFAANTREYAEFEMTATPLYDEDATYLFKKTEIIATN
jgi:hypothetical protein